MIFIIEVDYNLLLLKRFCLVSHGGAHIALTQEGLADQKESLEIPLRDDDNPTAILRPGMRGTITVYAYTAGNLVFTIQQ